MLFNFIMTIVSICVTIMILRFVLSLAWVAGKLWIKIFAYSIEFMFIIGILALIF